MKRFVALLALVLILAACSTGDELATSPTADTFLELESESELDTQTYGGHVGTYKVTIENLSKGQPFTPPVAVTHPRYLRLFIRGWRATQGVKEIAENGNVAPLAEGLASLEGSRFVTDTLVALGAEGDPPPILPGTSRSFEIDGRPRDVVSFVSMLICTNDGFTGKAMRLPRRVGKSYTSYAIGYDAGTELNTEDFSDIVPPCPALTGIKTDKAGTGESNPELAEGSVVKRHPNIQGGTDLLPELHGWQEPVAKITVKRID